MSQNMYLPVTNPVRGQQHKKKSFSHVLCWRLIQIFLSACPPTPRMMEKSIGCLKIKFISALQDLISPACLAVELNRRHQYKQSEKCCSENYRCFSFPANDSSWVMTSFYWLLLYFEVISLLPLLRLWNETTKKTAEHSPPSQSPRHVSLAQRRRGGAYLLIGQ